MQAKSLPSRRNRFQASVVRIALLSSLLPVTQAVDAVREADTLNSI